MSFKQILKFITFGILISIALFSCNNHKIKNNLPDDYISPINIDSIKTVKGEKFFELRSIINEYDPIGLIGMGSPEDEYDPEVTTIISKLDSNFTESEVYDLVYDEFLFWFGEGSTTGPKISYKPLARDIYTWLQKSN